MTDNCFLLKAKNYQQQRVNTLSVSFTHFLYEPYKQQKKQ